jgi:hypothetical protein
MSIHTRGIRIAWPASSQITRPPRLLAWPGICQAAASVLDVIIRLVPHRCRLAAITVFGFRIMSDRNSANVPPKLPATTVNRSICGYQERCSTILFFETFVQVEAKQRCS